MEHPVARRLSRRFQIVMLLDGLLVGCATGLVITCYRLALTWAEAMLRSVLAWSQGDVLRMGLWALFVVGLLLVVTLLVWRIPSISGSGIPQVEAELEGKYQQPWALTLVGKFLVGTATTLAGLSLGREGPSIQLGGMAAKGISRGLKKPEDEEHILMTCGAAAGMSAAFHAPLTGVMFAIEEIHKTFSTPLVIAVMASCIGADFVSSHVLGMKPVVTIAIYEQLPHGAYPFVLLLGVLLGLLGAAHNAGMFALQDLFAKLGGKTKLRRYAVAFGTALVLGYVAPKLLCGGEAILEPLENIDILSLRTLLGLLVAKYAFTALCFGSGAPGGTLFPLVVLGGIAGCAFGVVVVGKFGLSQMYLANFAMLGVCGLFASVVRSPVTAVILVFELTGSFEAFLSLSIVSICSYLVANVTRVEPFYERLLAALTASSAAEQENPQVEDLVGRQLLHGHVVEIGSALAGKALREVEWPVDALVVSIHRDGRAITPIGDTVLEPFDQITVIMDAAHEAEDEAWLKQQCAGTTGYISEPSA